MKTIYTHEELVNKLAQAQNEVKRLKSAPTFTAIIARLERENAQLKETLNVVREGRDQLAECLRWRQERDGTIPNTSQRV